jgi:hypothetical protein
MEGGFIRLRCTKNCTEPLALMYHCGLDPALLLPADRGQGERRFRVNVPWQELTSAEQQAALYAYAIVSDALRGGGVREESPALTQQASLIGWADDARPRRWPNFFWAGKTREESRIRGQEAAEAFLHNHVATVEEITVYSCPDGDEAEAVTNAPPAYADDLHAGYIEFTRSLSEERWVEPLGIKDFNQLVGQTCTTAYRRRAYDKKRRKKREVWDGLVIIRPLPLAQDQEDDAS